jgi:hypothetical protein
VAGICEVECQRRSISNNGSSISESELLCQLMVHCRGLDRITSGSTCPSSSFPPGEDGEEKSRQAKAQSHYNLR